MCNLSIGTVDVVRAENIRAVCSSVKQKNVIRMFYWLIIINNANIECQMFHPLYNCTKNSDHSLLLTRSANPFYSLYSAEVSMSQMLTGKVYMPRGVSGALVTRASQQFEKK